MFTLIVMIMLGLVGVFVAIWWRQPECRAWIEAPKYIVIGAEPEPPARPDRDQRRR